MSGAPGEPRVRGIATVVSIALAIGGVAHGVASAQLAPRVEAPEQGPARAPVEGASADTADGDAEVAGPPAVDPGIDEEGAPSPADDGVSASDEIEPEVDEEDVDVGDDDDDDVFDDDDLEDEGVLPEELEVPGAPEPAATPADPPFTLRLGDFLFRPSGEVRARLELRARWYDAPADRFLVTTRVRLGLDVRWQAVRAVIQLQDARDMGLAPGAASGASTGVFQGFLELGDALSFVRIGRQTIDLGTGRLIGSLNWQSAARSFDAVRARGAIGSFAADAFVALIAAPRHVVDERYEIDSEGDYVGGLSVEWVEPALRLGMDFLLRHDGPYEANLDRRRDVMAFTLRADGALAPVRYVVELIAQIGGQTGGAGMTALGAIGEVYVQIAEPWRPELGLGLTYGTGQSPSGSVSELDNFYPSNHQIYGLADLFGLRNQAQAFLYGSLTPEAGVLSLWTAGRIFALPEPTARWSNAPGATVGVDPTNTQGFLGGELDVEVRWRPLDPIDFWAGYSIFLPAAGAAALGRSEAMHFAYLMLGATFPR